MALLIPHSQIKESLQVTPKQGKTMLEPFKTFAKEHALPLQLLEDTAVKNDVEVHRHEGDLWFCYEGEVTFVCGGTLVNPKAKVRSDGTIDDRELKAKEMSGGTTHTVKEGDWFWIPAGESHQHMTDGTARLAVIKIPQQEVPLAAIAGWSA